MARALWKGVISFGSANVPVKLYTAVRVQHVDFHLMHDQDEVRLQQQMFCSAEEVPVEREHIVKGFEVGPDEYVVVEPHEVAELEPPADRTIEVMTFVEAGQIDPRHFDRPYHLGPDGEDAKYAALVEALRASGKTGICRWVMRKRSYLGLLEPAGEVMDLVTLRQGAEVTPTDQLELPTAKTNPRELKTAQYLVDELSGPFDPKQYHNEYQTRLAELVKSRAAGQELKMPKPRPRKPTGEAQLLKQLEASLGQVRKRKSGKEEGKRVA